MDMTFKGFVSAIAVSGALAVAGCSSGGGSNTGNLTLGLTDGPVEEADRVVIRVTGVEVRSADGAAEIYDISDGCDGDLIDGDGFCTIDLLELQGENRAVLFSEELSAGAYDQIRLLVDAQRNTFDSYLVPKDSDEMCSLFIPSSAQTGLKIPSDITVSANGVSDFTLDFDVRKSITNPPGLGGTVEGIDCTQEYLMKPVLRIVDTTETGGIAGTISEDLLETTFDDGSGPVAACEQDPTTMEYINASVYVFWTDEQGAPLPLDDLDGEGDPVTTASVSYNMDSMSYEYEAGFLLAGETYNVALTCDALGDLPDSDGDEVRFLAERSVDVTVNGTADGSLTSENAIQPETTSQGT
jgi:hypothetical protein